MSEVNPSCILLVDDEQMLLDDFSEMFASHFDRVLTANNGRIALEIAKTERIDLIISDISMPEMKGDDFLRHLVATGKDTPVIFLTGYGGREVVLSALRLGAKDVLEKPVMFDELLTVVRRVLEIERRKERIVKLEQEGDKEKLEKEKKMLGLFHVANESKKKTGS